MGILRIKTDDAIRERYGPYHYPNPFPPATFFHEAEEAGKALRALWADVLVACARALRRLPFFD